VRRREFITLIGGVSLAWPLAAPAQQPGKLPLIGVIVSASPPHPFADAFWRGLHALGYSEGQNIKIEFRYTKGRSDRAEEFAEEFVRLGVNVIVAHYAIATAAAMAATRTIPIVMAPHGAPLQLGVIASLSRPGGNVTGLSLMDAEIGGKRVQLLRELMPNLARIAVIATTETTSPFSGPFVEDLRLAASRAGLQFEPILIGGPSEFRSAFAIMAKAQAQAVIVQTFFDPYRDILIELAAKYRIAYMASSRITAAGGLVSMLANLPLLYERAAFYVDKILKGAKPADLPVEQPTKFDVAINMKTAKALGLTISPTLLAQVDEVID
jgi:putative tryptophan/tyrosine transport system substrate-binding protein